MYIKYTYKDDRTDVSIYEMSDDFNRERCVYNENNLTDWYSVKLTDFISWGHNFDMLILTESEYFLEML